MKIWKPLTKFMKQREEWAWHTDFALEAGEIFDLNIADKIHHLELCEKGKVLKVHLEICVEPFDAEEPEYAEEVYVPKKGRFNYGGEYRIVKERKSKCLMI